MRLVGLAVVFVSSTALAQVAGPPPEVRPPPPTPLTLPAMPSFELPPSEPGFVSVRALRVQGKKHLDTDVKVKGFVIWSYDCASAVAQPKESRAKTQKRIDEDPTLCERPKFYLGQTAKDRPSDGLWVVDVPRPPNKLEKARLPHDELKNWPKVPRYKVGDFVVVSGKFTISSPHSERNSDGLVVFAAMEPAKKTKPAPPPAVTPAQRPAVPAPTVKQVTVKPKDQAAQDKSIKLGNEGTKAYGMRKNTEAIDSYTKAIAEWGGNHVAYYGLGGAYVVDRKWSQARDAFGKAVELAPDQAMYHMVFGYALYESAIADAREGIAKRQNRRVEEVVLDGSTVDNSRALAHLTQAVKLEPKLWRAHYYIGRIHRDRGEPRWAAESFETALRLGPIDPGPWVALAEMYRVWYYTDEALVVAKQGVTIVPAADASDVWYVLGMAADDKGQVDVAIDALTKSLDARPDNVKAQFQRGQDYFKKRDYAKARADLEAFSASAGSMEFAKQMAARMLMEIAAKGK